MLRNKTKLDFNFTTLKEFKIIKLTTCDRFYKNKSDIYATTTAIDTSKKVIWRWSKGGKKNIYVSY
jgi:hypothetical protein